MISKHGELSGHSFRVSAALDLLDKNIPLEKIMLRGEVAGNQKLAQ